jgi:hypothetical protein
MLAGHRKTNPFHSFEIFLKPPRNSYVRFIQAIHGVTVRLCGRLAQGCQVCLDTMYQNVE